MENSEPVVVVTSATSSWKCLYALALGVSLQRTNNEIPRICLYASGIPNAFRTALKQIYTMRKLEIPHNFTLRMTKEDYVKVSLLGLNEFSEILYIGPKSLVVGKLSKRLQNNYSVLNSNCFFVSPNTALYGDMIASMYDHRRIIDDKAGHYLKIYKKSNPSHIIPFNFQSIELDSENWSRSSSATIVALTHTSLNKACLVTNIWTGFYCDAVMSSPRLLEFHNAGDMLASFERWLKGPLMHMEPRFFSEAVRCNFYALDMNSVLVGPFRYNERVRDVLNFINIQSISSIFFERSPAGWYICVCCTTMDVAINKMNNLNAERTHIARTRFQMLNQVIIETSAANDVENFVEVPVIARKFVLAGNASIRLFGDRFFSSVEGQSMDQDFVLEID